MGLDMYLNKTKRVDGYDGVSDYIKAENALDYNEYVTLLRAEGEKSYYTLEEYLGEGAEALPYEEAKAFLPNFKEYGTYLKYFSLWQPAVYWRKANHIHQWFVDNVQDGEDDCGTYEVSQKQLEELLDLCRIVLTNKDNPNNEFLENLLPRVEGFFFGSNDYDYDYFASVEETVEELQNLLAETDFDKELVVYRSSW